MFMQEIFSRTTGARLGVSYSLSDALQGMKDARKAGVDADVRKVLVLRKDAQKLLQK